MDGYYKMKIAGCERSLKLCPVNENMSIAAFIMFGDVEITEKTAEALLKRCPAHDIILTAEAKGIPLAYEMARQGKGRYVVARKGLKLYMTNSVSVPVKTITTESVQQLYLSGEDAQQLENKRVLIVDDVISTGEAVNALERLVEMAGGQIAGKACVLAEGDAAKRSDIVFLEPLPLFFQNQ